METVRAEKSRSRKIDLLLEALDFAGTFLFGMEGALAAIAGHLDFFGAMVLSFCTALGGGIIRDLLIGAVPPGSVRDWRYGAIAFAGGGAAVFFYHLMQGITPLLLATLDAGGLALFAVAGAAKALQYGIHPFTAILMGTITGVGGGTVRDVLLARVPTVLRTDIYATAALLGAALFAAGIQGKLAPKWAAILGAAACFALRMTAVAHHWSLPALGAH
jgi:uncharacterized membrane protein YeiH